MTGRTVPRPHFHALDSLRGLCACMVVLYHVPGAGFISSLALVRQGWIFVDFFFVLSGFVIATSYGERIRGGYAIWRYMALRLGRIWPLHAIVLVAFLIVELASLAHLFGERAAFTDVYTLTSFIPCLLLLQVPLGYPAPMWNGPSWSISAELCTYLVFGALFHLPRRWLSFAATLVTVAALLLLWRHPDGYMFRFDWTALERCCFGFGLGVLGAELRGSIRERQVPLSVATVAELMTVVAVVSGAILVRETPWALAMPIVFLLAVLVFSAEQGGLSRLLTSRPLLALGTVSYSIYIIHLFIVYRFQTVLKRLVPPHAGATNASEAAFAMPPGAADLATLAILATVIALSLVTHRLIENPANQWARRRFGGPRRVPLEDIEAPAF